MRLATLACLVALLPAAQPRPASAQTLAGAAAVAIRTPAQISLAGYGARGPGNRATGMQQPVSARALVLQSEPGARVGIVVLDALIVTEDLRAAIADASAGLALDALLVATTHTHSGPGGYQDDWVTEFAILGWFQPESREALVAAAVDALTRAADGLRPARLATALADGSDLARNRRHEGGTQDPTIPILAVDDERGAAIATLFSLAAHPTVLGPNSLRLSPDYPGAARRRVEARRGGVALFLAGALGDQKPHLEGEPEWPDDPARQVTTLERIGERLGDRVVAALDTASPQPDAPVTAVGHVWRLPPVDVRASCAWYVGAPLLHALARDLLPDSTLLLALRLGDLRILASPFELGAEVATGLRTHGADSSPLLVATHANGWLGYLLLPEDWDRGGYEPCLAYHGRDLAPRFLDEAERVLAELP